MKKRKEWVSGRWREEDLVVERDARVLMGNERERRSDGMREARQGDVKNGREWRERGVMLNGVGRMTRVEYTRG